MPHRNRRAPPLDETPTYTFRHDGHVETNEPAPSEDSSSPSPVPRHADVHTRGSPPRRNEATAPPGRPRRTKERRTSSGDSTGSFLSVSSTPGYRLRPVSVSDEDLVALAHETKRKLDWDAILRSQDAGPTKWKWQEHNGDFSIFVREDTHKYAVLAIGTVPGSVAEIVSVMHAVDNDHYLRKMEALFGDDFRDGSFVYNVDLESERTQELSRHTADPEDESQLVGLSVKTATFQKPSWLAKHEEWCYVDAVYQHPSVDGAAPGNECFEKLMTSLRPRDIIVGLSASQTKYIESVVSGYLLKPEVDLALETDPEAAADPCRPKTTRVSFYVELSKTTNQHHFGGLYLPSFGATATDKAVKTRLFKMARSCARLPLIIRRRRLGVQNVIDLRKVFPPTNTRCVGCEKFLLVAKICRLCGQGVCQSCSSKHYRETLERSNSSRTKVQVQHIRVCDTCITRVERSNYSYLTHTSLAAPRVRRDPEGAKRASEVLRTLLHQAYQSADSDDKRASVLAVMRTVMDQDNAGSRSSAFSSVRSPSSPGVVVTLGITNRDFMNALEYVHVDPVELDEVELAHAEGRGYVIDPREPKKHIDHPMPANEAQRLEAITNEHLRDLGNLPELNIVCDLAADELGCFATMVTVIDQEVQLILGANLPFLREAKFPRADTFCSHIIMDAKPLVVPHPEADIRFGQCGPVQNFGARYYCGFPLLANDGTVLGSLCCVDTKTHELTVGQYATLKQLARTASKVVRTATQRFDRAQLHQQLLEAARAVDTKSPPHASVTASAY